MQVILLRIDDVTKEQIDQRVKKLRNENNSKLTRNQYIKTILQNVVHTNIGDNEIAVDEISKQNELMIYHLSKIGVNLNQMAKIWNTYKDTKNIDLTHQMLTLLMDILRECKSELKIINGKL